MAPTRAKGGGDAPKPKTYTKYNLNTKTPHHTAEAAKLQAQKREKKGTSHLAIIQCADHPKGRAPPIPLLIRVALPDSDARQLPVPAPRGFQESVGLIPAAQEVHFRYQPLVERVEEALERNRFFVRRSWRAGVVLCTEEKRGGGNV